MKTMVRVFLLLYCLVLAPRILLAAQNTISLPYSHTFANDAMGTWPFQGCQGDMCVANEVANCTEGQTPPTTYCCVQDYIGSDVNPSGITANVFYESECNSSSTNSDLSGGALYWSLATPVSEIWIRFYVKYPLGWTYTGGNSNSNPAFQKLFYFNDSACVPIIDFGDLEGAGGVWGDALGVYWATPGVYEPTSTNLAYDWTMMNGGSLSSGTGDGKWHCLEAHYKEDGTSSGTNYILQVWVDGILKINYQGGQFSCSDYSNLIGNSVFEIMTNTNFPNNTNPESAIEIDDISMANNTYPPAGGWQHDGSGNQMIGTLSGSSNPGGPVRRFGPGMIRPW